MAIDYRGGSADARNTYKMGESMDPMTASLILGGGQFLSGLFGGPSEGEKAQRDQLRLMEKQFTTKERNRGTAAQFAQAQAQAQRALKEQLMRHFGGQTEQRPELGHLFDNPTNAFGPTGMPGSSVVSGVTPIQFSPEAMGANMPSLSVGRPAQPRQNRGGIAGLFEQMRAMNAPDQISINNPTAMAPRPIAGGGGGGGTYTPVGAVGRPEYGYNDQRGY
jgi:hypothetical protein